MQYCSVQNLAYDLYNKIWTCLLWWKYQKWPPYLYAISHGTTLLLWCHLDQIWRCRTGVWMQSISFYHHPVLTALSTLCPLHWGCCTPGAPQPSPLHTLPVSVAQLKQTQHTKAPQCHSLRAKRAILFKPSVHATVRAALPKPHGMCFFVQMNIWYTNYGFLSVLWNRNTQCKQTWLVRGKRQQTTVIQHSYLNIHTVLL